VTDNTVSSTIDAGIDLSDGDNNTVSGNIVSNCGNGISVSSNSTSNTISGNTVTGSNGSGHSGIYIGNSNSNILTGNNCSNNYWGIHLLRSESTELNGNTVTSNTGGIWLESSSDYNTLTGNTVTNNIPGIYFSIQSDNNTMEDNILSSNRDGIKLNNSHNNTLTGNTASDNDYGFYLLDTSYNTLEHNIASSNGYGIRLENADNNIIKNNDVSGSTLYGIWLDPSNNNQIYKNNFIDNATQAWADSDSTNNLFSQAPPVGGNYWSDWDESGPYVIVPPDILQDEYPWATQDGWLPVADAGPDQTVECACQQGGTQVTLNSSGSTGASTCTWYGPFEGNPASGDTVTLTLNVCLGEHEVTLVINEGEPTSDTDVMTITVVDTTPPEISRPGDIAIEAMGPDGVPKDDDRIQTFLNGASATDNCDSEPGITNDAPAVFSTGDTIVTFTAEDEEGNITTCQSTVTVEEAEEGHLRIIPKIINREGRLRKVLAVIRFPEGVTEEDINISQPLMLYPDYSPDGIEAIHQRVITWYRWGTERVSIFACFSKDDLTATVPENGLADLMIVGNFMDGSYFFGIDTVRIISWRWPCW
jgi:parallel beta-helix repeat protein